MAVERGAFGRVESQTLSGGNTAIVEQSYGYDSTKGRLTSASDSGQGVSVSYGYTANSDLISSITTSLNSTAKLSVAKVPDGLGRLHSISTSIPSVGVIDGHTYT
jgi:hypothetical protein